MLTSELLVTRIRKGTIEPIYASIDQENLELADSIIAAFQSHVGKTYGQLIEELEDLEEINYRLIRGLVQILERRCVIESDSIIDPIAARRAVFEQCRGLATSEDERIEAIERAAERLSIDSNDLEKALWADNEENLIIKEFQAITPEDLLKQYNLALAQTLLFKATGMEIQIEDNYQPLFWRIRQLGLMYSILDGRIYLDGPISLFKLTERYGTAFAKLLPTIIMASRWRLKANVLRKTPQGKKVYEFTLDNTIKQIFGTESETEIEETFDSTVEEEFSRLSFKGWTVRREPTILKAGKYAFIPDFSLERIGASTKVYVEIIGFWTPEYLKNKIQKINQLEERRRMILLVNRNLACSRSEFDTDNVIFYDRKIPHLEILKVLRRYEEKQLAEEIAKLKCIEISFESGKDVVSLDEVAGRYSVSLNALKEVIKGRNTDLGIYLLLGDQLVSNQILKTIQAELEGVRKHEDALKVFKRYGVKAHTQALECLGYKVKWSGLDPENAEIIKIRP